MATDHEFITFLTVLCKIKCRVYFLNNILEKYKSLGLRESLLKTMAQTHNTLHFVQL